MNNSGREAVHDTAWFKKTYGVNTSVHEGKMTGFHSWSTSCKDNARCAKNKECKGSICEDCYADNYQEFRTSLREACEKNGIVLRATLFEVKDLPILNDAYFRIEAFGDVDEGERGIRQARNYIRLAKRNPHTRFGWWSKNPDILDEAIRIEGRPKNISFIISSLYCNQVRDVSKYPWVDGVFTVYTKEYLAAHPEIKINCGTRQCLGCLRCYKQHKKLIYINELKK